MIKCGVTRNIVLSSNVLLPSTGCNDMELVHYTVCGFRSICQKGLGMWSLKQGQMPRRRFNKWMG